MWDFFDIAMIFSFIQMVITDLVKVWNALFPTETLPV